MYARFFPIVACIWVYYFLKLNNICSIVCICYISCILSSINGLLGCFHISAIVNNATTNTDIQTCIQILLWDSAVNPFEYLPRMELLDLMLILFLFLFLFWGMATVTLPPYAPFNSIQGIQLLSILANICYFFYIIYLAGVRWLLILIWMLTS